MYGTSSHVITPSCVTHQSPQPWCKARGVKAAILVSGVARQKRQSKLGLWNSLCTTEPTLLEVIKWVSKVHYAHIQLDDKVTSSIVYWAMKSRTGSVDAYPIPCNPQFQLQQTNHSQDLWHQVDLLRYRVNESSSGVVVKSAGAYGKLSGHPARPVLGWVARGEYPVPSHYTPGHYTCQAAQSGYRESVSWLSTCPSEET